MRIALDSFMHRHLSLEELPRKVRELGYDWIELSPRGDFLEWFKAPRVFPERIKVLKRALAQENVKIASLLPMYRWASDDENERQAAVHRTTATYFLPDGDSVVLPTRRGAGPIAATMDVAGVQAAIKEAQQLVPGYTYAGFCAKVMAAGCAGYIVSFTGRRAVYFGRTAETHVEHFPQ